MADPSVSAASLIEAKLRTGYSWDGILSDVGLLLDALAAQREALTQLREYTRHHPDCQINFDPAQVGVRTGNVYPCTCGLSAALAASPEGAP